MRTTVRRRQDKNYKYIDTEERQKNNIFLLLYRQELSAVDMSVHAQAMIHCCRLTQNIHTMVDGFSTRFLSVSAEQRTG